MYFVNVKLALPGILVALSLIAVFGGSVRGRDLVLGVLFWDRFVVVTRSVTQQIRVNDYVTAAEAVGASRLRIILGEILPNVLNHIIVIASLEMAVAILVEAALSFLGLGIRPPTPSWGLMISEGRNFMFFQPYLVAIPGIAILVLVIAHQHAGRRHPRHHRAGRPELTRRPQPRVALEVEGLSRRDRRARRDAARRQRRRSPCRARRDACASSARCGCGKTMTALGIMGLLPRRARHAGATGSMLEGRDLAGHAAATSARRLRGDRMAMIFQDPMTSLNPVYTIGNQMEEIYVRHGKGGRKEARERAEYLLQQSRHQPRRRAGSTNIRISSRAACASA